MEDQIILLEAQIQPVTDRLAHRPQGIVLRELIDGVDQVLLLGRRFFQKR